MTWYRETAMKHLLFVDHEPRILERINRMLVHRQEEWSMEFASKPHLAFEAIDRQMYDIIICDVNFPGRRGGFALLEELRDVQPSSVRIALSSFSEAEDRHAAYAMAHRFIPKPFDGKQLESVIERSYWLQDLYADQELGKLLSKTRRLPSVPSLYIALTEALRKPDVSVNEIEAIISQDIAMCAKILQMANSAYFGLRRKITSVRHAIVYLGMRMMRQLVFSVEIFSSFPHKISAHFSPEQIQRHAMLTSRIAADINADEQLGDEIFLASMLHDIGKIVLASHAPDEFGAMLEEATATGRKLHEAERGSTSSLTHTRAGAYLLGQWGMPDAIVEAVAFHHSPWDLGLKEMELPALIYLANALANQEEPRKEYLAELGVLDRLGTWRKMAEERRIQFQREQPD